MSTKLVDLLIDFDDGLNLLRLEDGMATMAPHMVVLVSKAARN